MIFGGDTFVQIEFCKLKEEGYNHVVETGTYLGDTTLWLAGYEEPNFDFVYSIELKSEYYYKSVIKLLNKCYVLYGDSSIHINNIMPYVSGQMVIFYLDTHKPNVLQNELSSICRGVLNEQITPSDIAIVIRNFENKNPFIHTMPAIKRFVDAIYGMDKWKYYFNTQSEGDNLGVIYIKNK